MKWTILLSLFAFSNAFDETGKFIADFSDNNVKVVFRDVSGESTIPDPAVENTEVSGESTIPDPVVENAEVSNAEVSGESTIPDPVVENAEIVIDADEAPPGAQTPASTQECSRGAMVDGECSIYLNKANKTELEEAYKGECSDA